MKICSTSHSSVTTYSFVTDSWRGENSFEHINNANAVRCGASEHNLEKLQRNQNALARVSLRSLSSYPTRTSETALATVQKHNWFKAAAVAFKVPQTVCPAYLVGIIHCRVLLQLPSTRVVMVRRAFSQAALMVWNDLPIEISNSLTIDRFAFSMSERKHSWRFGCQLKRVC